LISEPKFASIAEVAIKDGLTELFDHSTFLAKLETEIRRYKRYGSEVSLIMIDLDDFKNFNDTYGHQEGDRILRGVAALIKKTTRDLDIAARYGGEEFAIILPQTGSSQAAGIAERLREQVAKTFCGDRKVTISLGVAACPGDAKSARELVKKADRALYQSKANGKNQVTVSPANSRRSKERSGLAADRNRQRPVQ
jgi:diguanylate cyclase (GGDEF)-like protein